MTGATVTMTATISADHRRCSKQGFESHRDLLRDARRGERGPEYSAWIVESSRFLNVPHRAFQPDVGDPAFVDLPVNVGIIKAANGDITLYDSGWKQLAYIFDWNTSCCWKGLRDQMTAIGIDPDRVVRIILGHGHWDHARPVERFPRAVRLYPEGGTEADRFLPRLLRGSSTTATSAR